MVEQSTPDITKEIVDMVRGKKEKFMIIRLRFNNGHEHTFEFRGDKEALVNKVEEIVSSGFGKVVYQAAGTILE